DGLRCLPLADVGDHPAAVDDVVVQQRSELLLVLRLQEGVQAAGRQLVECRIGRGEDGEGTRAAQGIAQSGAFERLAEGLERPVGGGGVDEFLVVAGSIAHDAHGMIALWVRLADARNRERPKPWFPPKAGTRCSVRRVRGRAARLSGRYDIAS